MNRNIVLLALLIVIAFLVQAAGEMREFGEPENSEMDDHMIDEGQEETGSNNIVSAVVFDYRGFDTLGEATVLFTAVTSVSMIFRKGKSRRSKTKSHRVDSPEEIDAMKEDTAPVEPRHTLVGFGAEIKEMSKIVKTVTNIIYFFILIFGLYIILHGHLSPGGGFQGGAVIASAFALVIVAYGSEKAFRFYNKNVCSLGESAGLVSFLGIAFFGIGTAFFYNQFAREGGLFDDAVAHGINSGNLNTGGMIPLMNIAVGLEVISAFGVILLSMLYGLKKGMGRRLEE